MTKEELVEKIKELLNTTTDKTLFKYPKEVETCDKSIKSIYLENQRPAI